MSFCFSGAKKFLPFFRLMKYNVKNNIIDAAVAGGGGDSWRKPSGGRGFSHIV